MSYEKVIRIPNDRIAHEFLKRDINNIARFFTKRRVPVEDSKKLFEEITK